MYNSLQQCSWMNERFMHTVWEAPSVLSINIACTKCQRKHDRSSPDINVSHGKLTVNWILTVCDRFSELFVKNFFRIFVLLILFFVLSTWPVFIHNLYNILFFGGGARVVGMTGVGTKRNFSSSQAYTQLKKRKKKHVETWHSHGKLCQYFLLESPWKLYCETEEEAIRQSLWLNSIEKKKLNILLSVLNHLLLVSARGLVVLSGSAYNPPPPFLINKNFLCTLS